MVFVPVLDHPLVSMVDTPMTWEERRLAYLSNWQISSISTDGHLTVSCALPADTFWEPLIVLVVSMDKFH